MKTMVGVAALVTALAGVACKKRSEHAEGSGYGVGRHDPANIIGGGDNHLDTDKHLPSAGAQATSPHRPGDLNAPDAGPRDAGADAAR
jgi:hypothetical protein